MYEIYLLTPTCLHFSIFEYLFHRYLHRYVFFFYVDKRCKTCGIAHSEPQREYAVQGVPQWYVSMQCNTCTTTEYIWRVTRLDPLPALAKFSFISEQHSGMAKSAAGSSVLLSLPAKRLTEVGSSNGQTALVGQRESQSRPYGSAG